MRLQLTVQRHGIPPVQVLWTVTPTRPPLAAAGSSITISQFLEQVNDIIPLESEDWGLEDYTVEVRGFECLHFSELGQVLKEDDEVSIRPLHTTDLRIRRISGRHQISADGKHLIDGIAFGRPYLRRADRPAVRIPPRKRRRITYHDEEDNDDIDEDEEANDQQMVLRAGFNNADGSVAGDDSDEEDDFLPDDENDEDLGAELEDLQNDSQAGAKDDNVTRDVRQPLRRSRRKSQKSPRGLGLLQLLDENGQTFVGEYDNPLLDKYGQVEPPTTNHVVTTRNRRPLAYVKGGKSSAKTSNQDSTASLELMNRRDSAGSNKSVHFGDVEPATPVTVRESHSSDQEDDDDFEPGAVDESDKENAEPRAEETDSSDDSFSSSGSSSIPFSEQCDSDATSSSGSSSSDSSSDSELESEPLSTKGSDSKGDGSSTSSTSSSDSSDSDSESGSGSGSESEVVIKEAPELKRRRKQGQFQNSKEDPESMASKTAAVSTVPPGKGKRRTMLRNQRRREQKALAYLKSQGTFPQEATRADLLQYKISSETAAAESNAVNEPLKGDLADLNDAFRTRRQALLASIANGGIEIDPAVDAPDAKHEETATHAQRSGRQGIETEMTEPGTQVPQVEASIHEIDQGEPSIGVPMDTAEIQEPKEDVAPENKPVIVPASTPEVASKEAPSPSSQQRRSKLDVSGAKRMLFGSLGIRTPRTKQDEVKTREELMKGVKPVKAPQAEPESESLEDIAADNSWKDKIDLRAVECCHDGIKLSTPPFPFVQRWDPQQQRGYNNHSHQKRKGKKRKRNNNSYYEESSYQDSQTKAMHYDEYQVPEGESALPNADGKGGTLREDPTHDSYDRNLQDSQAVSEQLLREAGEASTEMLRDTSELATDLPPLPNDPTACPSLTREAAQEGTVIAFKQLEMSAETNWQPRISEYRTAIVDEVTDNGVLQMTPAKRDRPSKLVEYDDQTGERLYSKFEMPGYNDQDDIDKLEISFDELINPVLLRAAQDELDKGINREDQNDTFDAEDPPKANPEVIAKITIGVEAEQEPADNPVEPGNETREQISDLIRDAGWRSSVQSELQKELIIPEGSDPQGKGGEHDDTTLIDAPSPRFNGFSSSPLLNVRSSPPVAEAQSPKRFFASGTVIAESVPPQEGDAKSSISDTKSAIEYPSLPQLGDDSELFPEEAQRRSEPPIDHQSLSQDLTSNGRNQSPVQSERFCTKSSQENSPSKFSRSFDGPPESEDEFPEPFSQAWENRMSQEIDIKPESSQENFISPPSYRRSKASGRQTSSQRESNRSWKPDGGWSAFEEEIDDEDDCASTPRPSQQQKSSQVIDLTFSSDSVNPVQNDDDDDDDSYKLPKGPGWVSKTSASRERSVPTRSSLGKAKTKTKNR